MVLPFVPTMSRGMVTEVQADSVVLDALPTLTTISFDNVNIDVDDSFDPGEPTVVTLQSPGTYLIVYHLAIAGVLADNEAVIRVRSTEPDGSSATSSNVVREVNGSIHSMGCVLLTKLVLNEQISLEIGLSVSDTADSVQLGVIRIA